MPAAKKPARKKPAKNIPKKVGFVKTLSLATTGNNIEDIYNTPFELKLVSGTIKVEAPCGDEFEFDLVDVQEAIKLLVAG